MNLVKQTKDAMCGQACVSMVIGCSLEDAVKKIGHGGVTTDEEMIAALELGGRKFRDGPPPEGVWALQKHRDPNGSREHWTVWDRSRTLDPACLGDKIWPVYKHVVIPKWLVKNRVHSKAMIAERKAVREKVAPLLMLIDHGYQQFCTYNTKRAYIATIKRHLYGLEVDVVSDEERQLRLEDKERKNRETVPMEADGLTDVAPVE